jgi:DNA-binding MarR family transcriptional regulator
VSTKTAHRLHRPASEQADLARLLGRLHRSVRRNLRRDWPHRPLTDAELELLRLVNDRPDLRVQDAASLLGVAANTVSTLVGRLAAAGLLERRVDDDDARAVRLAVTASARRRFAAWRDRRQALMARAIASLDAEDRRAIHAATPALARLLERLESE